MEVLNFQDDTLSPWYYVPRVATIARMSESEILLRFGERVRELRKAQGYSQEDFAYACELDRSYMGGIERGERNVALRNVERIAQTLGITLSQLMKGL